MAKPVLRYVRQITFSNCTLASIHKIGAVFLGLLCLFGSLPVLAEGSKELNPTGGHRAYLYSGTNTTTSMPWANEGLVRVYAQAGEVINVGSSAQGRGNGRIVLYSPSGQIYQTLSSEKNIGYIADRAEELAGPKPNAGGYEPFKVTVPTGEDGVWSVYFIAPGTGTGNPARVTSNSNWNQGTSTSYIAAFDVTVRNGSAAIPGRAYMNLLEASMGQFDARFTGKVKVLTNDGYIYDVDANGLAGNGFAFFSNNKGFKNGSNPSYQSRNDNQVTNVHPPLSEDGPEDFTHKLFFNSPAPDLPVSAPARTTTGAANAGTATTTWLKTEPISPELKNFSFIGVEGTPNQAGASSIMGGFFGFEATQPGNYSIRIDVNGDGDYADAVDRIISSAAVVGANTVFWDGLDGTNTPVVGAFDSSNMQVVLRAGEVHFPMVDVENNPGGVKITRLNGVGAPSTIVYWDDSNISSTSDPSNPRNTSATGRNSDVNGHVWGSTDYEADSFGNEVGLDTWTYVFSTPVSPTVPIDLLAANLEILPISKSKTTGICIGDQQTYTVSVRNNGPSDVTDAQFEFTFPPELTGVVVTPVVTSGTAIVSSSTTAAGKYRASLDMNNSSVLTFTITGTVSAMPPTTALDVKATVMRPADVYDPDATNPDTAVPTDPQAECDAAPSGAGCNNIKNDSTPVSLSELSVAAVSETEGSGGSRSITFTVSAIPANASCDVTVNWAVTHGTTDAADFAGGLTGTVTIPAGQASATFSVPMVTDQIIEADETFMVTLSNPSSGGVITTGTATGTIVDDDNIPANKALVITPNDGAEGVSPGASFTIGFPAGITADKDTEIQYSLAGTAESGSDYTGATTGTVIISALTNSVTVTLPVIDDVVLEGNETITVTTGTVTSPYAGITVSNSPVTLTIADDDNAILISGPAQMVEGDAGTTYVTFRVSLDISTSSSFTIDYTTEDGVATTADNDYVAKSGTLTFTGNNPGEYFDIQIAINGDVKIEGNESFKVKLHNLSNNFGGLLTISGSPATMSILDDDNNAENKTITITKVNGAEGGADAEFIFSFPPGVSTDAPTTISYTLGGVAAGNGTDYNGPSTGTVVIPAGAESASFTRAIVDDLIIEDSEAITITTGTVTNTKYNGIGVANSPFSTYIIDNDNTTANNTISLTAVSSGAEPTTNGQFRVSYPAGIVRSAPTTVNYTIGGTAQNGTDYNTLSGSVIIPANSNSAVIDVDVTDDLVIEATETVALTLTSATSGSTSLNIGPAGAATINITDNDNIAANNVITLTKVLDAEEGLSNGQFRVSFPSGIVSSVPTTVNYTIAGTATSGSDYTGLTGQVIIPAGSNFVNIDVLVSDDLIIETTETISLTLTSATNTISTLTVDPSTVTATLRDNDNTASNSIITLTRLADGAEPAANPQFLVRFPAGVTSAAPTTVNYLIAGTALNGIDYATLATSVVIPAGANSAVITATVADDQQIEATETIVLSLTTATNSISIPGLTVQPSTGVSADIVDDDNTPDKARVTLTRIADGAEPGTNAQFQVSYPAGVTNSSVTTVKFKVGGTAIYGADYTMASSTTVYIPANTNAAVINVPVADDFIIEPTETVTIEMESASSSNATMIALDPAGPVSANIADNDNTVANKTITISRVDGVEATVDGSFVFSFPSGITASAPTVITFGLSGSASEGADYTASSPVTITIPAGQNSVTLPISVKEDDIVEDAETVILTVTSTDNPEFSGITVSNSPQTLTISDNDNTTLIIGDATVTEGNAGLVSVTFTVSLDKATGRGFSLKYATEDGTATVPGNDYISKTGTLNFSGVAGESQTVTVDVRGDQMIEMNETFRVRLSDLSDTFGTRLAFARAAATGTITDDDLVPANLSLTITPANGSETGPMAGTFTLSFPSGVTTDAPTTVHFGLSGTASGTDYTGAASSVTIPAGQNSATLTLPVVDDNLVEHTETIILTSGAVDSPYGIVVANSPQAVEIADNDNATVAISAATVTEGQTGTSTLTFTVTLDKDTGAPFTLNYATSDGTATVADADYAAAAGTLTFSGTAGSQTIAVSVKGDQRIEADENISIAISNLSNNFGNRLSIPAAGSSATGTISNDDSGVIAISSTDGMEAGPVAGTFTFAFPAGVSVDQPTVIHYSLSGTAESGADYTGAISGSVTIPANANSVTLELPVIADLLAEDTETVVLTTGIISSPYAVTVGNSPRSLNIIDQNQAVLSLTGPATITEGQNGTQQATYTVTLNQATAGSFTVDYLTGNGTATVADADYQNTTGTLSFGGTAGETRTFTVPVNGDLKIEADENFSVSLTNLVSSATNRPYVQATPVVTSIVNDDSGVITITSQNGSETGPAAGAFTFSFPAGVTSDAPTTIYLGLTGTADAGDYTGSGTGSVTIPAGDNSVTLTLPVTDDLLAETTESVIVTTGTVSSPYGITVANTPHSLDITDNDNATVTITGATVTEGNSGTTALSFTVTLDKDTGAPFTVDYATADGTATAAGNDYVQATGTLTFNGAAGSQTIVIPVKGDLTVEPDENFTVTLGNLSTSFDNRLVIPIAGSQATGIITNDDSAAITITAADGSETGPVAGTFTFSFPAGVTVDAATTIAYTLSGTAESGSDHAEAITGTVTIPAGDNSVTLNVGVTDDAVAEDTETVMLTTGTITSPYTVTVANSPQSLNITDNDQASVSLTGPATITEGNSGTQVLTYTVTLDKASQAGFTVDYATADGTASVADNDYTAGTGTLTFTGAAGETRQFQVLVNGDQKIEANEDLSVVLSNLVSAATNRPVIQTTPVVSSIVNDDSGAVTITSTDGSETGPVSGTLTFSFAAGVTSDKPTTISFGLGGTASATDYTAPAAASVTPPAGDNSITISLPGTDDTVLEGTETIVLTPGTVTGPYGVTVTNTSHTLNITDNDQATLVITGDTKPEGDAAGKAFTFTVTLDKATSAPFTVDYQTGDGTAKVSDQDYVAAGGTLSFSGAAGESRSLTVTVTGDRKIENNEDFTVTLGNLSGGYGTALTIGGSPASGVITNDDTAVITVTPVNGSEAGAVAGEFRFSLPAGMTMDTPVNISYTLSGTAESGKDYTGAVSGTAVIPADANSFTLVLPVTDDAVVEDSETVVLTTGLISSPYALTVANSPQTLSITDNDQARVTLSGPATITEGSSGSQTVTYTATLDRATQGGFTVDYVLANGTATVVDGDYSGTNGSLTFAGLAGEKQTFTVTINGDLKIEADETFSVTLGNLVSSLGKPPVAETTPVVTTIMNDDSGAITIASVNGSETGPVAGTYTFSFPAGVSADAPTTISFGLAGTAGPSDYTGSGTGSVIIPAGDNSITLTLPVIDDTLAEGTETVVLTAGSVSSPYGITLTNSPKTLEIADNDQATLTISGATVAEGNSGTTALTFTVTLDKATGPFSVNYATADGTATAADTDYSATTGTLHFNGTAGESRVITVSVNGDARVEADEAFNLTLSGLSDDFDGRLAITAATVTGTITNDDSGAITITSSDGAEAGPIAGTFTFSYPAGVTMDAPTTIHYTLSGTAISGTDYTGASGSIVIPAQANSVTLTLPVSQDLSAEDTETVILTTGIISSPYGVTVNNSPATLNIIDRDQAAVSLTGPATLAEGSNGTVLATYTVTLNQATGGSFTVDYATSDGTASLADADYLGSSGTLAFAGAAGEKQTFTVQINGDRKIEANENFSVTLSNLVSSFSNRPVIQTPIVVTTIENDDSGVITLSASNGSEAGPVPGTFTFSFPAGVTSDTDTKIHFALGGTAVAADYTGAGTLSVTIPANGGSAVLNLGVNDDAIIEGTETVVLTAGAIESPYGVTIANSPITLTIADNDQATLTLSGGTVTEGDGGTRVINFTVTLDKATRPFTVNYATADGTATAGSDYTALSGTLNFAGTAGESRTVAIAVTGDRMIESDESFTMTLSGLSVDFDDALILAGSPATGVILDDDNTVSNRAIVITTVHGAEGGADASVKFSFPGGVSTDGITSVPYTLGGTAQGNGTDYDKSSTGILYIPAGENSVTLPLIIRDDAFIEGTETVLVNTGAITNDKYTGFTANGPQTVNIADNDGASLSVAGPVTIVEGHSGSQTMVFRVTLDKATGTGFSVEYSTEDGTALSSDNDFIAVPNGTLVFEGRAGEVQTIEIQIIGDRKIEQTENFQVRLGALSTDFNGALTVANTSATGTITDDDNSKGNKEITITHSDGTEGASDGSFTFSLPAGVTLDAPTTIPYTLSGTARGAGIDYTGPQVGTVVIPAGQNHAVLTIAVTDDSGLEPAETVIIRTGAVTNDNYDGLTVANTPHTLTITDDDNASLSIAGPVQVTEGHAGTTNAVFNVSLDNDTGAPFTVEYATKDGSATTADGDYIAVSGMLTFSGKAGDTVTISVPVKGDLKIEKNEEFTVRLSGLSQDFDGRLSIQGSPAVGTIMDDDQTAARKTIAVTRADGEEGGNGARFRFSFPAGVSADSWTTVHYSLTGTASPDGVDYAAAGTGSVTILPGENSVVLDLPVIDDAVIEATETVTLAVDSIANSTHSGIIATGSPLTLSIADNDSGELTLSSPVVLQECDSCRPKATFSVTLSGATGSPFSIGYSTFDITARVSDNDYLANTGSLKFSGLQGEVQTITVSVVGDRKIESDEEFGLMLRDLSDSFGGKLTFSAVPAKGVILNDDNGTITITKTDGKEGSVDASFTFSLPDGVYSDKAITIPYTLSGTASGNTVDYLVNTSGSVTIPAGANKADLNLIVKDDSIIEPTETVKIATGIVSGGMPNAVLVENSPLELAIEDNDKAPVVITNPVIVREGNNGYVTAVFSATLPLATAEGFTVDYASEDGTATADEDYTPVKGRLTFAGKAGEVQQIEVRIKGDVLVEGDEKYVINLTNLSETFGNRLSLDFRSVTGVIKDDDIAPMAVADEVTTREDVAITFSLIANDSDPDGIDPTSITIKTRPAKGELQVHRDGTVTYTPAPDDNGMQFFTYTVKDLTGLESNEARVTITITPVSDPPVAEDDQFYVTRDGTLRANVGGNDADPDGEALTFRVTVPPANGTLVAFNEADGSFVYIPTAGFTGVDQFTYQVADPGGLTDAAVVTIGVQPKAKARLTPAAVTVKEGEAVRITAELSEPLLQDVTLTLGYAGDAVKGEDYRVSGVQSFFFKAGETRTNEVLILTTVKDYMTEGPEVAQVSIASADPTLFVEIEGGSEVTITDPLTGDKPAVPGANDDITPDPLTSPNGDGQGNEAFVIHNITRYPDNEVVIFNRWGTEVFRVKGYDNKERAFTGVANTGTLVNKGSNLPDGIYYYIIYTKQDNEDKVNKGYVVVKR